MSATATRSSATSTPSARARSGCGPGTLYGTIKRLLGDGLIEEAEERPDPALDDERRRYYRLTPAGAAAATAELDRLASLVKRGQRCVRPRAEASLMGVYRHLLRLYPKSVRSDFGDAMEQVHRDLRVHGGLRGPRLFLATTRDLMRSAPRLRVEEAMATHPGRTRAVVTILVAAALVGLVAIGPLLALPALVALVIYMARHADDLDGAKHSRALWLGLPIAGGVLLARRHRWPTRSVRVTARGGRSQSVPRSSADRCS